MDSQPDASPHLPGDGLQPPAAASASSGNAWIAMLIGAVVVLTMVGLIVGGVFYLVFATMRSTGAYKLALRDAQNSPCVVQRLGSPLTSGMFINGVVRTGNSDGSADLEFSLHGPKGSGRLHVLASEVEDTWYIQLLSLKVGDERIQLLPQPSPCE